MVNLYSIVLALFCVAGLGMIIWGWRIMAKGRQSMNWPKVEGEIIQSEVDPDEDDLLPHIVYRYKVHGSDYDKPLQYPSGTNPSKELSLQYLNKYPKGSGVIVYHHPNNPSESTLEPGPSRDDWFIIVLGIITLALGLIFLLAGY